MIGLREKILGCIEQNAKIDVADLAVMFGLNEVDVAHEISAMEKERITRPHKPEAGRNTSDSKIPSCAD